MSDPAISVVLPAYNHLRYLPAAVEDIYRQTRTDWELIVVNDGSTDETAAWLAAQSHPQLRVIHQENRGACDAINTGIRAARGEYVTWVSADNRCASYFLEALAAPLDLDAGCTLSYSAFYGIDDADRVTSVNFDNLLLLRELVNVAPRGNAGFLYRRDVHDRVGFYETWVCDTLMWARIVDNGRCVFVVEPTYFYRFHNDRATVSCRAEVEADKPVILKEFLARHGGAVDAEALLRLYPGLSQAPADVADAAADFSIRLFANRAFDQAFGLQLAVLSNGDPSILFRPLVSFLALAARGGADPLPHVRQALNGNGALSAAQRDALLAAATALDAAGKAGLVLQPLALERDHRLIKLEKPDVFSFCAWRENRSLGAVTAL